MAGWTTPATWAASEVPTSAKMNAQIRDNLGAINGYVIKTATESVTSSTVLQNDDELLYAIGQTGTYLGELHLPVLCASGQTGDIKFGFSFPTGTFGFHGAGADVGLAAATSAASGNWQGNRNATSGTTSLSYATTSSLTTYVALWFHFAATATGTVRLMWAQDVSNANAAQVLQGAWMHVKQVV